MAHRFSFNGYSVPSICFQCPKPDCLKACPHEAIYKNENEIVLVDKEKCDGCGDYVTACPYGMIEQDETAHGEHRCRRKTSSTGDESVAFGSKIVILDTRFLMPDAR
jgi:Fe-S-cluster-containing dehydrogenase component